MLIACLCVLGHDNYALSEEVCPKPYKEIMLAVVNIGVQASRSAVVAP
jgi:hypothetical protein